MKKFALRAVLDGFRSTVGSSSSSGSTSKADAVGVEETIWSEHFQVAKVGAADYQQSIPVRPILDFAV